jgi:hypothetical protein
MAGFLVLPPSAASPGGILNPSRVPFWGLNDEGFSCNEGPLYEKDPWDTFFINDIQLPGKCWVANKSIATIDVEKSKGKNSSGARIRFFGYLPGAFDMICRIATPEQWLVFQEVQDRFWAGPLKEARPPQITVKVKYPDINRLRVYQAVLVGVPLAEDSDLEGAKNFRLNFHEQVKQKATTTKVAGGAVPEFAGLPGSSFNPPLNAPPPLPSTNPKNFSLDGPPLQAHAGAQ